MGELLAAIRDASWYHRPNTSSVKRYHVQTEPDVWQPACNPRNALLSSNTRRRLPDVPPTWRCRRPGCAQRWPTERPTQEPGPT